MSSVSNGLYFLTLPLVSVMRVVYRKIRYSFLFHYNNGFTNAPQMLRYTYIACLVFFFRLFLYTLISVTETKQILLSEFVSVCVCAVLHVADVWYRVSCVVM